MGYMFGTIGQMNGTIIVIMDLCVEISLAIGFSLLSGTFLPNWKFIRAMEKRDWRYSTFSALRDFTYAFTLPKQQDPCGLLTSQPQRFSFI
jgi:hypothetical protein